MPHAYMVPNRSDMANAQLGVAGDRGIRLRIAAWNSRGVVASIPYLRELMRSNDIICLSEHWLHENRLNCLEEISSEFNAFARASAQSDASTYGVTRGQGGIAILWRKTLGGISPMTQISHDRICGIRAQTKACLVLNIYSVYMPSPGCSGDYDVVLDEIAEIIQTGENGTCNILCGDFNADMGYMGGRRSNRRPTKLGKTLYGFFNEFELVAANMQPITTGPLDTFRSGVGSSMIDYMAIPESLSSMLCEGEDIKDEITNTSDHFALRIVLGVECGENQGSAVKSQSRIKWSKLKAEQVHGIYTNSMDRYTHDVLNNSDIKNCNKSEIDEHIESLVRSMNENSNNLPKSKYKPHVRPFWKEKLKILKKEKVVNFRIWVANGRPRSADSDVWLRHKNSEKAFRREIKYVQKEFERRELEELLKTSECDKNRFWKTLTKV